MLDQKFWEKYFSAYDILNRVIPYQELLEAIAKNAEPVDGKSVLDAGSGTGNLSIKLEAMGANVSSFDFSEAGIKLHKQKSPTANVVLGDLTKKLPFVDSQFDLVVSNNVIYTLNPEKRSFVFGEFYRVMKSGGRIVISNLHEGFSPAAIFINHIKKSVKNKGFFPTFLDAVPLFGIIVKIFYYNYLINKEHKDGGFRLMQKDEQKKLMEGAGFSVLKESVDIYSGQSYLDVGEKK